MRAVRVAEDIVPVSELKAQAADWLRRLSETDHPIVITLREIPEIDLRAAVALGRGEQGLTRARAFLKATRWRPSAGLRALGSRTSSI